jgi:very-short-patch-repair endonuclease
VVVEVLARMGGVATRAALIAATSRAEVDTALGAGDVVAVARGRYALVGADQALVAAHRLSGVASHFSAALLHGWQVRLPPEQSHVTVPRNRVVPRMSRTDVSIHWADLGPDDVLDQVTTHDRTLTDCMRTGPFDAALCVADSALRDGYGRARLLALARDLRGPGSALARRVANCADSRAANAFESMLRAIAIEVPGLRVVPQVPLRSGTRFLGRPDLVDERLGIILEADSFEWHGSRAALTRDSRRYNLFAVNGWLVLRFTWEDVVFHPLEVAAVLRAAVAERAQRCIGCRGAA